MQYCSHDHEWFGLQKRASARTQETVAIVGTVAAAPCPFLAGVLSIRDAVRMIAKTDPAGVVSGVMRRVLATAGGAVIVSWLIAGLILCMFGDILLEASRVRDNGSAAAS